MPKPRWTQRQDIGPAPRGGHALAYDETRSRTVLFGGEGVAGVLADTWEWDGAFWTQRQNAGPAGRAGHRLVYDGGRIILFGGGRAGGVLAGDTWSWDGADWTQLDDQGPMPRYDFGFAREPGTDRLVLFGGSAGPDSFGDTWAYEAEAWTQVDDSGPSGRSGHILVPDPSNGRLLLFGGSGATGAMSDTWAWQDDQWTQVQDIGPGPRTDAAAAAAGRPVLFGGAETWGTTATQVFATTWDWDGSLWTERDDIGPSARWNAAAALDSDRSVVVMFGGFTRPGNVGPYADSATGDTWELPVARAAPAGGIGVSLIDFGPSVAPSDGFLLQFRLAAPPPVDTPVIVTLDGAAVAATPAELKAGSTEGFAAFSMVGRSAGSLALSLRIGSAHRTETLDVVGGAALLDLTLTDPIGQRGRSAEIRIEVLPVPSTRVVNVVRSARASPARGSLQRSSRFRPARRSRSEPSTSA